MKTSFKVELISFNKISYLPNSWNNEDYINLLEIMDYGDISDIPQNELKDMCFMLLTDNEPEEAATIILKYIFKSRLNDGQIENLSNEMLEEKMWEEYADLSLHEEFFNVHQVLYNAFNGKFPIPEAVQFKIKVSTVKNSNLEIFETNTETPLIRLLVNGMPETTLINRLFEEQLEGTNFKDSKDIIWQLSKEIVDKNNVIFTVISSLYWFKDLKYVNDFEGETHKDE